MIAEQHDRRGSMIAEAAEPVADSVLDLGRAAILAEAAALSMLAETIDATFIAAIDILRDTRGRVLVGGLGKSGHIARKMAATLVATGTPAMFLHAGDSAHGDLGAIVAGDTLLLLSNSGETRELGAIAARARLLGVSIVLITSRPEAALALGVETCLMLPDAREICPFDSAPTTSTTMMLALCDALAVTLMQQRGVSREDIRALHPGGRLGRDLVPVERFMHHGDALPLALPDAPMATVLELISDRGFGIAIVVDASRRLEGIITDGDIRRHAMTLDHAVARDVMTVETRTIRSDALARDALAILSGQHITALVVVQPGPVRRVMGLVHVHDLLQLGVP